MIRLALIAVAALALPAVAAAKPPPVSSVSQYVEDIPTASGPSHQGEARQGPAPSGEPIRLSERTEQALATRDGEQARRLRDVALGPRYGAPQTRLPAGEETAAAAPADARFPSAGELAGAAGGEAAWLIGLLAGTAVAVGAWARARR